MTFTYESNHDVSLTPALDPTMIPPPAVTSRSLLSARLHRHLHGG